MTAPIRFLAGITTTGTPHLGNYVGAIRPSVQASRDPGAQNFYFLADYHALIKCDEPARIQRSTLEIAACWLAAGLDPEQVFFYRQSDIPEITELTWLLTCVTGKGLLNRAHAYKASVDKNTAAGNDHDADVTAGLFMYPVLMGADILLFNGRKIPVGRDQIQHIEMARDMAQSFNHLYGEHFVLPEAFVSDSVAMLPGLDGRKMSKSYDNVIALFAPPEQMRRQIAGIVTDSRAPGEPKPVEGSALFQIYEAFATPEETRQMRKAYADGIAWGDAKQLLFERIDREIAPLRGRHDALIGDPAQLEQILRAGADKARAIATPFMARLRHAVGLRNLGAPSGSSVKQKSAKAALPSFKQYREADGLHYFKLIDAAGRLLAQSKGFQSPQEAGQTISQLKQGGLGGMPDALQPGPGVAPAELESAMAALAAAWMAC
ncbi:MAG: tryptophan--tRNA ligase [Ramlibacter sp.]|nr:tryptophan--tRNA ligase [Ramlibacter sp.]